MGKWNFYTSNELKPRGWLKRQLEIQAKGLSGNLDKIWPDVRDSSWIGGDREGWERVPYWLDGFIPLAYLLENEDMIRRVAKYINAILSSQNEDGWICPCDKEQREYYDTWAVLLITKVLIVYYDCAKDERIPKVVYRVLKNFHMLLSTGKIKLFNWGKFRWFEGFIAIDFTYKHYQENWLLELARILKEQGADYPSFTETWKRPLNWWRWETHIVNLTMMLKYEAVSCALLGQDYVDKAEDLYRVLDKYNGTPVGLFTGDECLAGISPIHGTELCAVVEQMYSYELLYAYTGDNKWAERLEVLAFNALPATISDDMWSHQYVQMSNQIACVTFPGKSLFGTNDSQAHLFGLEPNYGCCTANFHQGWPKFALSSFLYEENTVINCIPVPSELKTENIHIVLDSNYPFENSMNYTIKSKIDFVFKIRIPSFAKNLTVNGKRMKKKELSFVVKAGETKNILVAFETKAYFEKRPNHLYTAKCGSLVFSLPIKYQKQILEYEKDGVERKFPYCDYEYIPLSDWNYAYCSKTLILETRTLDEIPFSSEHPPVVLKAIVQKIDWGLEEGYETACAKIPHATKPLSGDEEITLYPYGCAKLRMTELPFTKKH